MSLSFVTPPHLHTTKQGYIAVIGTCGVATLLLTPLVGVVDVVNIALLFVLVVVLSASRWGQGAGIAAAFLAVLCFDFFFVPPRFSLTVEHAQYLITFVVMLVVSLVISQLTHAYQVKAFEAQQRSVEAHLLQTLACELSGALTVEDVQYRLQTIVFPHFQAQTSLFLPDATTDTLALIKGDTEKSALQITVVEMLAVESVHLSQQASFANAALFESHPTLLLPLCGSTKPRGMMALHFAGTQELGSNHAEIQKAGLSLAVIVATAIERIHFIDVARQQELEMQSERLRNSILSTLSHDLRTPLTLLYGQAEALAQHPLLPLELTSHAYDIRDCSHRLHSMVDNLLDMARLRSGRVELHKDWQSLPELIGACLQHLRPYLPSERIRFEFDEAVPLIQVDAVLFESVLYNLLENAHKYASPNTPIGIGITVDALTPPKELKLSISNHGVGFPSEHMARVFQLFERGPTESNIPGVGVGLAVCQAIVEAHGGRIQPRNTDTGCAVDVWLPLHPMPPMPDDSPPSIVDALAVPADSEATHG